MAENKSTEGKKDDEIDWSLFFSVLWKRRKLILIGTVGATLLSIVVSILLPKVYRSEGFFQLGNPAIRATEIGLFLPENQIDKIEVNEKSSLNQQAVGVPVPLYKSISSQFFNPNHFQFIAIKHNSFADKELLKLKYNFRTAEDIRKWIKPVYAFTKEDAREFIQLSPDRSNSVIGLNLSYETNSPSIASAVVDFFGYYIRDCILYGTLYKYVLDDYSKAVTAMNKNENEIFKIQFDLLQNTNKMEDIRAILSKYPESAKIESRQLVSVQDGGSRFLSPITQLVGIESTLADLRRDLSELKREREKLIVLVEYFTQCASELKKIDEHGESLFLLLKSVKNSVFSEKDLDNNEVKEVFNNLSIDLQAFDFAFNKNTRFISGPTIPTKHIWPRKSIIIIGSCMASFFFFIIMAFVVHWWDGNKYEILSSSSDTGENIKE